MANTGSVLGFGIEMLHRNLSVAGQRIICAA